MKRYVAALRSHWMNLTPLALLAGLGFWMTGLGGADRAVAEAPRVTLAELEAHAGSDVPVLLVARAVARPPLVAGDGSELALQSVYFAHDETAMDRTETVIDYEGLAPGVIWAAEDDRAVRVETRGVNVSYIPEVAAGETGPAGRLTPEATRALSTTFTGLPRDRGLDYRVRSIGNGEAVSIYGVVEMEDGSPVVRAPGGGRPFAIAGMEPDAFVAAIGDSGEFLVLGGRAVIAFSFLMALLGLWIYARLDGREATASAAADAAPGSPDGPGALLPADTAVPAHPAGHGGSG